jgi:virginiamycin B lyase
MDILSISGPAISLKTKHFRKAVFCIIFVCSLLSAYQAAKTAAPSATSDFPKFDASTLPITAKIRIGGDPDWLAIGFGSVWVSVPKNNEIVRINPKTNSIEARIKVGEEPCYGIGVGKTHVWVLNCKSQTLTRIRPQDNTVDQTNSARIAPHGEGAVAIKKDVVWYVGNEDGHSNTLLEIDDRKSHMMTVGTDSAVVNAGFGSIWVTSSGEAKVYRVAPKRHKIIAQISVPASPRFTTIGEGSVWVLSQSDGSVSRIDPTTNKVIASIPANIPGAGGDIAYGGGTIWVAASGTPVMRIDPKTNKVIDQYGNYKGADAIRFGFGSVWVSDHGKGDLWRIDPQKLGH